ncbi:hypothetical protein BZG35_08325 [Brevundimonas sp. LM2]|uniref:UrcA family protein n=1 Tax=Brevundimonas sp. LM2 TaxID=1938605 RepID=UPI000983C19C|nr:UrcA family protein [Brevundimonas sp. LM2]AQR61655.1 hypothetical protein BZG35_08325 [Brevundimonas sp. LM2]
MTLLIALAAMALSPAPPAAPKPDPDLGVIRVSVQDLRLDRPADQDVLVDRIDRSVAAWCAVHGPAVTPHHHRFQRQFCLDGMRAELVRALDRDQRRAYDAGYRRLRSARPNGR